MQELKHLGFYPAGQQAQTSTSRRKEGTKQTPLSRYLLVWGSGVDLEVGGVTLGLNHGDDEWV